MGGISSKVAASGVTGAVVGVLVWVVSLFGLDIPAEISAYIVTILSFAAGYFIPETRQIPLEQAKVSSVVSQETKPTDTQ